MMPDESLRIRSTRVVTRCVSPAASLHAMRFLVRAVLVRGPFRHGSLSEMSDSSIAHMS